MSLPWWTQLGLAALGGSIVTAFLNSLLRRNERRKATADERKDKRRRAWASERREWQKRVTEVRTHLQMESPNHLRANILHESEPLSYDALAYYRDAQKISRQTFADEQEIRGLADAEIQATRPPNTSPDFVTKAWHIYADALLASFDSRHAHYGFSYARLELYMYAICTLEDNLTVALVGAEQNAKEAQNRGHELLSVQRQRARMLAHVGIDVPEEWVTCTAIQAPSFDD